MDFAWAEPYPEVRKICILFERYDLLDPSTFIYQSLPSYLQTGPQCGLVALSMLMGKADADSVHSMFQYAKRMKFTYNGEIFSVDYMHLLAQEFLKGRTTETYCGGLNNAKIKNFLLSGGKLLVPYDTDKDNSPGFFNGHKAHWCAISGAIKTDSEFFVLARHGKARNVAIWTLDNLARSNQQLLEFSPERKLEDLVYRLPDGGVSGPYGLSGRSILIHDTKNF